MGASAIGTLYIVPTPIGNLEDLSRRTEKVLSECDLLACEDTRVSGRLLSFLSLSVKMISYREENEVKKTEELSEFLASGKKVALLSDAGYPSISDPGFRLVRECHRWEISIVPLPGPNAALTALAASGLPTHQFLFWAFFPRKYPELKICSNDGRILRVLLFFMSRNIKSKRHSFFCANLWRRSLCLPSA